MSETVHRRTQAPASPSTVQPYRLAFDFANGRAESFRRCAREWLAHTYRVELPNAPPAHCTIKYSLNLMPREAVRLGDHIQALAANRTIRAVQARFGSVEAVIGSFVESSTIYLEVFGDPLIRLRQRLIDECASLGYPKQGYEGGVLHVTLVTDVPDDCCALDESRGQMLRRLGHEMASLPYRPWGDSVIDRVVLYRPGQYQKGRRIILQ